MSTKECFCSASISNAVTPVGNSTPSNAVTSGNNSTSDKKIISNKFDKYDESKKCRVVEVLDWSDNSITGEIPRLQGSTTWNVIVFDGSKAKTRSEMHPIKITLLATDDEYRVRFFVGADYLLQNSDGGSSFATPLPHLGLLTDSFAKGQAGVIRSTLDFKLTGTTSLTTNPVPSGTSNTAAQRTYEFSGGLLYSPPCNSGYWVCTIFNVGDIQPTQTLIMYRGSVDSVENSANLLIRHFIGFRFLQIGTAYNSSYLDLGTGGTGNLAQFGKILKIEGFLPLFDFGMEGFIKTNIETPYDNVPAMVGITIGLFTDIKDILNGTSRK